MSYRKDTYAGHFDKAVCEKMGCSSPCLDVCSSCTMYRSCLDEKERAHDAQMRTAVRMPNVFFNHCHSCGDLFKTTSEGISDCGCKRTLSQYLRMEGR